jgi:hypothetical protein
MIRKPSPEAMRVSATVDLLRNTAASAKEIKTEGAKVVEKAGSVMQGLMMTWFGGICTFGVVMTLLSNLSDVFSIRGIFVAVVMLAIPLAILWSGLQQFKKVGQA